MNIALFNNAPAFLSTLFQFLVLLPVAASCYLPAKNQMKYSLSKTAALCSFLLFPFIFLGTWLCKAFQIGINIILLPCLILFFILYLRTVKTDFPRSLAIFVGVCAVQTFPAQFAYALDAQLHPASGAAFLSPEAALFQLIIACLMPIVFAYPACHHFAWAIDCLDLSKVWYSTAAMSAIFLIFNLLAVPHSYSTLHAGRMSFLFPAFEICALTLLTIIYVLFYQGAKLILEHANLVVHTQLLETQAHQYQSLQAYMQQTARLRHDFRHHLRLLASLADQGDLNSIRTHLAEYEIRLEENIPANYCSNAALNALFGYYHEMAAAAGININWKISLPDPLTVSEVDLASLFGNLMENAIAGCQNVPRAERYFGLAAEVHHGCRLYIVSANSFDGIVRKGRDGYRSTKHSGKGTGLASILAVAEKYHGSARFSNNDQKFFVDVILKV